MALPLAINDSGQTVGAFGSHGFLYAAGTVTQLDVPGATSTRSQGINNAGQIVATYTDSTGTHGFLATPTAVPEPATLPLCTVGLIATTAIVKRRRR
jgi:hypothetical protein